MESNNCSSFNASNLLRFKANSKYKSSDTIMLSNGVKRVFTRKKELDRIKQSQLCYNILDDENQNGRVLIDDFSSFAKENDIQVPQKRKQVKVENKSVWQKFSKEYEKLIQDKLLFDSLNNDYGITQKQMSKLLAESENFVESLNFVKKSPVQQQNETKSKIDTLTREMTKRVEEATVTFNRTEFQSQNLSLRSKRAKQWRLFDSQEEEWTRKPQIEQLKPKRPRYPYLTNSINIQKQNTQRKSPFQFLTQDRDEDDDKDFKPLSFSLTSGTLSRASIRQYRPMSNAVFKSKIVEDMMHSLEK